MRPWEFIKVTSSVSRALCALGKDRFSQTFKFTHCPLGLRFLQGPDWHDSKHFGSENTLASPSLLGNDFELFVKG
jgi:hypothetical protein